MTQRDDQFVDEKISALLEGDEDLQRMVAGDWMRYRTSPALKKLTWEAHATCATINRIYFDDPDEAKRLFYKLIPGAGSGIDFRPPISIDYGARLVIGDRTFINADFLIIGGGPVTIGADCLIGPRCGIYTPNHAEDITRRLDGWELAKPITIGNNVWIGGSVTITPGVMIGDNSIIGAGSVVTRDIPAGVVAAGNPCHPIRPIKG
jgi:maltose O-acetyltransferase